MASHPIITGISLILLYWSDSSIIHHAEVTKILPSKFGRCRHALLHCWHTWSEWWFQNPYYPRVGLQFLLENCICSFAICRRINLEAVLEYCNLITIDWGQPLLLCVDGLFEAKIWLLSRVSDLKKCALKVRINNLLWDGTYTPRTANPSCRVRQRSSV